LSGNDRERTMYHMVDSSGFQFGHSCSSANSNPV